MPCKARGNNITGSNYFLLYLLQNGRLLIHWAALGGNEHLLDYLIDHGSPADPADDTDSTPLTLAASAGKFEVARRLLGKGANVNQKTKRKQTPLHYACSKGHKEVRLIGVTVFSILSICQ